MKRLIVNADDFGLTRGVNRAIAECHRRGIVSSTTLMATSARFDEAVEMASQMPRLSVGCHVVLLDGEPILPPDKVRSLLAPGSNRFYNTVSQLLPALARGRFNPDEVEAEARAQMARIQAAGVRISHFDSHKHTHMFPQIFRPLLRAAAAYGVRTVRNPFEPTGTVSLGEASGNRTLLIRKLGLAVLRAWLRGQWMGELRSAGFSTPDGSLGLATTGTLDGTRLRAMLRKLPPGTWELVCHPGYNDTELDGIRTILRASREIEMQALLGINACELREQYGAELVGFGENSARPTEAANI